MKSVHARYIERLKRGRMSYQKRNALLVHLSADFWLEIGNVVDPSGRSLSSKASLASQRKRVASFGDFSPDELRRSQQAMARFFGVPMIEFSLHFHLRHWFVDLLRCEECSYLDVMICACREFVRLELGQKKRQDYKLALWGESNVLEFFGDHFVKIQTDESDLPDASSGWKLQALAASAYKVYRDPTAFETHFSVSNAECTRENALWVSKPVFEELRWFEFGYDLYLFSCLLDDLVNIFLIRRGRAGVQEINRSSQ